MRLIDADALKDKLREKVLFNEAWAYREETQGRQRLSDNLYSVVAGIYQSITILNLQPTIEERKTGKWEITGERKFVALDGSAEKQYRELGYPHHNVLNMRCSNCNKTTMVDASIAYGYCPHCGARMEGAGE